MSAVNKGDMLLAHHLLGKFAWVSWVPALLEPAFSSDGMQVTRQVDGLKLGLLIA